MAVKRADRLIQLLTDQQSRPSRATVFRIDGSYLDVRFGSSPSVVRNVEVVGDPYDLSVGDEVLVYWESQPGRYGKAPVVYVNDSALMENVNGGLPAVDGVTIDYGVSGLHVPRGGIAMENLNFLPALDGHEHRTPLEEFGWNFTNDGIMFSNDTYIHPDGQIAVGTGDDVAKLDSLDFTYRLWIGAQDPADAPFSVTKAGVINATAGYIAGWEIVTDTLAKNDVILDPDGRITVGSGTDIVILDSQDPTYRMWIGHGTAASAPFKIENDGTLKIGTVSTDMLVMSTTDATYRLWIGDETPGNADFRVSHSGEVWLDNAHIDISLESDNYSSGTKGWKLDSITGSAEFQDVIIRGELQHMVLVHDSTAVFTGRSRINDGDVFIADVDSLDTTIDVRNGRLQASDICQIQTPTATEWIKIEGSATPITGGHRYNVVRDLDGSGADDFYTGEGLSVTGSATYTGSSEPGAGKMFGEGVFGEGAFVGSAYYSSGGMLTIDGTREWGPYFGVTRRFGPEYNQLADVARFGLLEGFLGETRYVYGIAVGDATDYFKYTDEDGLEIVAGTGGTTIDSTGFSTDNFALELVSSAPDYTDQFLEFYVDDTTKYLRGRYKDVTHERDVIIAKFDDTGWGTVDTSGTPVANDYAKFTDEDTIEGREYSEVISDLGLGTGIANGNYVEIDGAVNAPVDGDYAKFTATGIEGMDASQAKTDLSFMTDLSDDGSPSLSANQDFNSKTAENVYSLELISTESTDHSAGVGRVYYDTNYVPTYTELVSGTYGGLAVYAQKWAAIIDTNNMVALDASFAALTVAGDVDMKRTVEIVLLDGDTALATGDDFAAFYWTVPEELDGYNITEVDFAVGTVSSSGLPSFDIYNVTGTGDVLTVNCTIDANETSSYTATTGPTINGSEDDLTTGDQIRFDCDVAGTGTKGCTVILVVEKP